MHNRTILLLTALLFFVSCNGSRRDTEPQPAEVSLIDGKWNVSPLLTNGEIRTADQYLVFGIQIRYEGIISNNLLYASSCGADNCNLKNFSGPELFAVEKMEERLSEVKTYYESNFKGGNDKLHLTTLYIRETPRVYADKTLFGTEPGTDLSRFFVFAGGAAFRVSGVDYKIDNASASTHPGLTDFFADGTIVPKDFIIHSTSIPEELSEDEDLTVTFVFPVIREYYWSWLLQLYDNPDVEELFSETDLTVEAKLKEFRKRQ